MNLKKTELIEADRLVIARVGGNGGRWSKGTNISVIRSEDGRYSIVTMDSDIISYIRKLPSRQILKVLTAHTKSGVEVIGVLTLLWPSLLKIHGYEIITFVPEACTMLHVHYIPINLEGKESHGVKFIAKNNILRKYTF